MEDDYQQTIFSSIHKIARNIVHWLSPDSLAFSNAEQKYTIQEFMESEELKQKLEPGDIIVTRTPSRVYDLLRQTCQNKFDHLAVAVSSTRVLHISPPRIRLIPAHVFMMKRRSPLIIRMKSDSETKKKLVESLTGHLNEEYHYSKVFQLMLNLSPFNWAARKPEVTHIDPRRFEKSNICTDLVAYYLFRLLPNFNDDVVTNIGKLHLTKAHSFTCDDFVALAQNGKSLEIVYTTPMSAEEVLGSELSLKNILSVGPKLSSDEPKDLVEILRNFMTRLSFLLKLEAPKDSQAGIVRLLEIIYVLMTIRKNFAVRKAKGEKSRLKEFAKTLIEATTLITIFEKTLLPKAKL